MKSLSVVSTMYQSAPYLEEFVSRVSKEAQSLTCDFEIILVNDGSPDASLEVGKKLIAKYPQIRIVNLSKNFGHHPAMMAGLKYAKKEFVFLIDCDLEEPPEVMSSFYKEMMSQGVDVVYGIQKTRKGSLFNKICGFFYYKIFSFMTNLTLQKNILTVRLMTQRYVKALLKYQEKEIIIGGLWYLVGFEQLPINVDKKKKKTTSYNFLKLASYFIESIISFSFKPLYLFCYLGMAIFCLSVAYSGYIFLRKLFFGITISGWSSIMMSIWFLGGTTILFLSVISLYLAKVFAEVKARPRVVIKEIISSKTEEVSLEAAKLSTLIAQKENTKL